MTKGKWTDKVQREDFDRMVKGALTKVGAHLVSESMNRCPRKTGRLLGSITWATIGNKDEVRPDFKGKKWPEDHVSKPGNKYTCYVGTNTDYAQHVEYGTRIPTPAQPYLRPALDDNRKVVKDIFKGYIKDMVRGK